MSAISLVMVAAPTQFVARPHLLPAVHRRYLLVVCVRGFLISSRWRVLLLVSACRQLPFLVLVRPAEASALAAARTEVAIVHSV